MKDRLGLYLIKMLSLLPLKCLRCLASSIGFILWHLRTRAARTTAQNLAICFPNLSQQDRANIARASLQESVKTMFEAPLIWKNDWPWISNKILFVEGADILQSQLAQQKGLIILVPHIGNWEVTGPFLNSITPLTILYQPLKTPLINKMVLDGRQKNSSQLVPTNTKGVGQLLRRLRAGGSIIILPDQVPDRNTGGEIATFLGHPALTMTLVHNLIQKTGCLVCCCYAERVTDGFKIVIMDVDKNIYSESTQVSVTALNNTIATCVLRIPTQYQWEYKRFRRLPAENFVRY